VAPRGLVAADAALSARSDFSMCNLRLFMANCPSNGDWQFKQPVAMALPTVILKGGWLRSWTAGFFPVTPHQRQEPPLEGT
jgi:hypothetical protein